MRRLRSGKHWIANLMLAAISLTLALAGAELVLRLVHSESYEIHPRDLYSPDPVVGYIPTPGFKGSFARAEYRHPVELGSSGLRGGDPRPRGPETFRIVTLGDSFTWGLGVGDDETYPKLLEQLLSQRFPGIDIQVLNAGVPGYGTADELRFLESRIELLDPDLVTVQFLAENDFNDNRRPALDRVEVRDGWLHAEELPRPGPAHWLEWLKQKSLLARLASERAGYLAARLGLAAATDGDRFDNADADLAIDLLAGIAELAQARGAETLFIFATSQTPVVAERAVDVAAADVVAEAAAQAGAGFVDLTPALRAREDRFDLYYPLDGHWTAAGHAATAEILDELIAAEHGDTIAALKPRAL